MGSASWIHEGTPALPPLHPHSTVFYQLTLYPLVNLVPFTGNTSTSQLLWRASSYPQFTLQFPTRVLDTHKVLVHRKSKHKSPQSSFRASTYRQWSCLQLHQVCQSASSSLLTLFGISASHTPPLLKFNY